MGPPTARRKARQTRRSRWLLLPAITAVLTALAHGQSPDQPVGAETARPALTASELWPMDRVLDIEITLRSEDWDKLRHEGRDLMAWFHDGRRAAPPPSPFEYVPADVTIDGVAFPQVGLRKKGFLGSLSNSRPSLKIKLNYSDKQGGIDGITHITLNNNRQDRSLLSQFMGYAVFRAAGSPVCRCGFAKVSVNGNDLGVYCHVESMKRPFFEREFGSDKGVLYEGRDVDFRDGWADSFERKFGKKRKGRKQLQLLAKALESEQAPTTLDEIGKLVDLDAFYRFWATETLLGFWDGYSGNRNNFYVYLNPQTDRFHFLPWGLDVGFQEHDPDRPRGSPVLAGTTGILAHKLYQTEEGRQGLAQHLEHLLRECWDEEALLAEIDRVQQLVEPHVHTTQATREPHVEKIRRYITTCRQVLLDELAGGLPEWSAPPDPPPVIPGARSDPADYPAIWDAAKARDTDEVRRLLRLDAESLSADEMDKLCVTLGQIAYHMDKRRPVSRWRSLLPYGAVLLAAAVLLALWNRQRRLAR